MGGLRQEASRSRLSQGNRAGLVMDAKTDPRLLEDIPSPDEMGNLMLRLMRGINNHVFTAYGDRVLSGPFAGMMIPSVVGHWDDGNSGCKLIGSYEYELHDAIRYVQWRKPEVVINIGCAEGYYAIGFARLLGVPVYAFDSNKAALALCDEY